MRGGGTDTQAADICLVALRSDSQRAPGRKIKPVIFFLGGAPGMGKGGRKEQGLTWPKVRRKGEGATEKMALSAVVEMR